jgi:hypothetical protein
LSPAIARSGPASRELRPLSAPNWTRAIVARSPVGVTHSDPPSEARWGIHRRSSPRAQELRVASRASSDSRPRRRDAVSRIIAPRAAAATTPPLAAFSPAIETSLRLRGHPLRTSCWSGQQNEEGRRATESLLRCDFCPSSTLLASGKGVEGGAILLVSFTTGSYRAHGDACISARNAQSTCRRASNEAKAQCIHCDDGAGGGFAVSAAASPTFRPSSVRISNAFSSINCGSSVEAQAQSPR